MGDINQLCSVLNSICTLFDRLLVVENNKLDAIAINDVDMLDEYMRAEQAFTMELRGLDARREKILEDLGLSGLTMSTIIERYSGEDRTKLSVIFEKLQERTEEIQVAVACTKRFIELHLQSLDLVLDRMGEQKAVDASYVQTGEKKDDLDEVMRFATRKV